MLQPARRVGLGGRGVRVCTQVLERSETRPERRGIGKSPVQMHRFPSTVSKRLVDAFLQTAAPLASWRVKRRDSGLLDEGRLWSQD
jgi:hypothetical protein